MNCLASAVPEGLDRTICTVRLVGFDEQSRGGGDLHGEIRAVGVEDLLSGGAAGPLLEPAGFGLVDRVAGVGARGRSSDLGPVARGAVVDQC
jgi:hypothetical protein